MDDDSSQLLRPSLASLLYVIFLRLVAISCLWFGLEYWALLVGYSAGGHGRFDLLDLSARSAATTLAVVFPVAALGLWLASSWGSVMWAIAAGLQVSMFVFWTDVFGEQPLVVLAHVAVVLVYLLFQAVLWFESRHRADPNKI